MRRYRTVIVLLLLGVILLVAAVFAARFLLIADQPSPAPSAPADETEAPVAPDPAMRKVFGAARALPVGTLLGEEDLRELELEADAVRRGHIVAEGAVAADVLRGHAVREALVVGEPLTWSAVVGPRQRGFLSAVLKPGTRAVTIQLEPGARQAGLIDPGDRVDVILTAGLKSAEGVESVLTRMILEDVRVVAVDRQVGGGGDEPVERTEIATATLEVLPSQADRLALGKHEGRISLAVRSLAAGAFARRAGAGVNLRNLLSPPSAPADETEAPVAPDPAMRKVFAAARALPVGTLLGEEDLRELELEADAVRRGHIVAEGAVAADVLRGHAVREALVVGEPLTWSAVVGPRQRGFLSAVLKPGTRAVTIQLEPGARQAGLIDPGDRVDVILTAGLKSAEGVESVLTRMILEDVRVVAVDRQVGGGGDEPVERTEIATATLEVLPSQADRLALGKHEGRISLAVRSLAAGAFARRAGAGVNLRNLLSPPSAPAEAHKTVRVIRGDTLTQESFPDPQAPASH